MSDDLTEQIFDENISMPSPQIGPVREIHIQCDKWEQIALTIQILALFHFRIQKT
jgi:hypothetical protein